MKKIILLRHGESEWNRENRFTGWTDVDLTADGIKEAARAGDELREQGYTFDRAFTSYLKRAVKTLDVVLDRMNLDWIAVDKSWRLNEKHYGVLQGLNKAETAKKFGEEQVHEWRRSYDIAPGALAPDDPRSPLLDKRYADVPRDLLPLTESLADAVARVMPYWECEVLPALTNCDSIIVVAHGNSLRAIVKNIKGISDDDISSLNIPTAEPWVFEFDDNLTYVRDYFAGNADDIRRKMAKVAAQGSAK